MFPHYVDTFCKRDLLLRLYYISKASNVSRQHGSGTYEEVIADGTKTVKVIGDNYELIMGGSNVYVSGAVNLTIGGDVRHLVKGNELASLVSYS